MIERHTLVDELIRDLNLIRTEPINYVHFLEQRKQHHLYNCIRAPSHIVKSLEGTQPIDELINDLGIPVTMSPLNWSYALHTVADIFSHELGSSGTTSHFDSRGRDLKTRLAERCAVRGKVVELIQVSGTESKEILTEMLVDDGLATRKRRRNLLDPSYHHIGIGVAPHSIYGYITVIILAEMVTEGADLANKNGTYNSTQLPLLVSLPNQIKMTSGVTSIAPQGLQSGLPIPIHHENIRNLAFANQQQIDPEPNRCNIC